MSEGRLEILRRGIDAFNARDIDRLTDFFEPETELHSAFATALAGLTVYEGHEGVREWHRELEEAWGQIELELEEVFEEGEHLLAHYRMRGRGRLSEVEVAMPIAHLIRFRGDRITWLKTYTDRDAARRDLEDLEAGREEVGS